jgi:predicted O-methyltransferase YrrM
MATPQDLWTAVDRYITDTLAPVDASLQAALADSDAAGLPAIHVSAPQGKLLQLLAQIQGATRILEVGTLAAYSTIWLARGLAPGGRLITLEADPRHAAVARRNLARAGLDAIVEIRIGMAIETMGQLGKEGAPPFDLIFVDANKDGYPEYFELGLALSRPGTIMVFDNVVRDGGVVQPNAATDPAVAGVLRLNERIAAESRVNATAIQTVGMKGYDGFALVVVTR